MKHRDERPRIDQEDKAFADRLAAHYAPPPWTSAKRVGFDEALRARVERPQRRGIPGSGPCDCRSRCPRLGQLLTSSSRG